MAATAKAKAKANPAPVAAAAPARLPTWATISTMKETPEVVMDFIAHHLLLGASEMFIFFDDPDDPAIDIARRIPQVRAIPCDAALVAARGPHPPTLPPKQKIHARMAYAQTTADWIAHIDADEFIHADRPVAQILAGFDGDVIRLLPFEALSTPKSGHNGRPENYFRAPLPDTSKGQRIAEQAYAPFANCLTLGMLSHVAGKAFVRTGLPDMSMSVHMPFRAGKRTRPDPLPDMRLLHMHGSDYDTWRAHLERRLVKGTYSVSLDINAGNAQENGHPLLETLLYLRETEGEAGLKRFYRAACTFGAEKRALRLAGALMSANLWLPAKRAAVFGGDSRLSNPGWDADTGQFEADAVWDGLKLRLVPDNNFTEALIARGKPVEAEELETFRNLARGRKVLFHDIGGNAGVFSLAVAQVALPASRIIAFEPNPEMRRRFARNVALNGFTNIDIRPVALGRDKGEAFLSIVKAGNLGQASLRESAEGAGFAVPVKRLTDEMANPKGYDLSLMKIDVEGHEAGVLAPLLEQGRKKGHWPDFIMLEHTSEADWGMDLIGALKAAGYGEYLRTEENIFLEFKAKKG